MASPALHDTMHSIRVSISFAYTVAYFSELYYPEDCPSENDEKVSKKPFTALWFIMLQFFFSLSTIYTASVMNVWGTGLAGNSIPAYISATLVPLLAYNQLRIVIDNSMDSSTSADIAALACASLFITWLCVCCAKMAFSFIYLNRDAVLESRSHALLLMNEGIELRKSAEEATLRKKEFMRYVFHEVRVPFNVVCMGLDTIMHSLSTVSPAASTRKKLGDHSSEVFDSPRVALCDNSVRGDDHKCSRRGVLSADDSTKNSVDFSFSSSSDDDVEIYPSCYDTRIATTVTSAVLKDIKDMVEQLQSSSTDIMHILDSVLLFDKADAHEIVLVEKEFTVEKFFSDVEFSFRSSAVSKNVKILSDIDPKIPRVLLGDMFRMKECLGNFVSNALKYAPPCTIVTLKASLIPTASTQACASLPACRVRFSVIDNGVGIAPEHHHLLFQAFKQVPTATGEVMKHSTGLGLSIVKKIIALANGVVGFHSDGVNKGSTFYFEIPLKHRQNNSSSSSGCNSFREEVLKKAISGSRSLSVSIGSESEDSTGTTSLTSSAAASPRSRSISRDCTRVVSSLSCGEFTASSTTTTEYPSRSCTDSSLATTSQRPDFYFGDEEVYKTINPAILTAFLDTDNGLAKVPVTPALAEASSLRILVVDDSAPTRKLMSRVLKTVCPTGSKLDYVHEAEDGCKAIDLFPVSNGGVEVDGDTVMTSEKDKYDVIFTDYEMPNMNGVDCIRRMRSLGVNSIIIGVTGNALLPDKNRMIAAGATMVITKPVRQNTLQLVLKCTAAFKQLKSSLLARPAL